MGDGSLAQGSCGSWAIASDLLTAGASLPSWGSLRPVKNGEEKSTGVFLLHRLHSKLFESLILTCCKSYDTCHDDDYQFGYKKDHPTSLGCATLKHVVDYYRSHGSYVFVCFLDLSKAFDSVDLTIYLYLDN